MIPVRSFEGKDVAVFGLGRSGIATCKALMAGGARVCAWDDNEASRKAAEEAGFELTAVGKAVQGMGTAATTATGQVAKAGKGVQDLGTEASQSQRHIAALRDQLIAGFAFKELVQAAAQMEQVKAGLQAVAGDSKLAGDQMEFVRRMAQQAGHARLDDYVNLPASRLAALWLVLAASLRPGLSPAGAIAAVKRDARHHRSPNAGWPESAMAGALGIKLAGPRVYGGVKVDDHWMGEGRADLTAADIRAALDAAAARDGWPALHARLQQIDPIAAARIPPLDSQRLQRALEVWMLTGKTLTQCHAEQAPAEALPWQMHWLAIAPPDRALLHQRIALRFDQMLTAGLIEEVRALRARGDLHLGLPSMRSVGYRQVWQHLDGEFDLAELRERGLAATRQLAKRQLTWLRSFPGVTWLDPAQPLLIERVTTLPSASA